MILRCLRLVFIGVVLSPADGARCAAADDDNFSGSLVFPFSRDAERAVARAEAELQRGDLSSGLTGLQALLDQPSDSLILRNGTYRSTWETANGLLGDLSEPDRVVYQRVVGQRARQMLVAARRANDGDLLMRLTDQFRHSEAGRVAAIQLVVRAANRGELRTAARWLEFIDHTFPVAPASASLTDVRRKLNDVLVQDREPVPSLPVQGSTKGVPAPTWHVDLGLDNAAQRAVAESLGELDAQALNPIGTCRPLIVGRHVVARTLKGVLCVDAVTGERRWEHDFPSYVANLVRRPGDLDNQTQWGRVSALLMRRIVRDSLQDEMATDGQLLFLIVVDDGKSGSVSNVLRAIDLTTGRIAWQRGDRDANPSGRTSRRESANHVSDERFYLGPPLVDGDRLLILAQRRNTIELLALDSQTGESLWTIPIGTAVRDLSEDRERRSFACRLSMRGTHVLCPTGAGGIACVDVLQRRIRWAYRYPRRDLPQHGKPKLDVTHFSEMPARDAWLAATAWWRGDRVVCVSPESDALDVLNAQTGAVIWTQPRGESLAVLPFRDDGLLIAGASSVAAKDVADGSLQWVTQTDRLAGAGVVLDDRLVVPTMSGRLQTIRLDDGTLSDPATNPPAETLPFQIETHPPGGWRSVALRNLTAEGGVIISQSPASLERITVNGAADDQSPSTAAGDTPMLAGLLDVRANLHPILAPLQETDIRVALTDAALTAVLEAAGLHQPMTDRIAELVAELERSREAGHAASTNRALQKLQGIDQHRFTITADQQTWSCRLDRWLMGRAADGALAERDPREPVPSDPGLENVESKGCLSDASGVDLGSMPEWPPARPTVIKHESSTGPSYFVRVPMTVDPESPWNGVTVEVDRNIQSVWFHHAAQSRPVTVMLPRESGSQRRAWDFLHAWARDEVLVLRIGTELIAFHREAGGRLPDAPLWPLRGRTLSLLGPRPSYLESLRKLDAESAESWNAASPRREDLFDRRVAEVGPVRADYLCYQQRGHLIAIDSHTGIELWRRSRLPVGTRLLGDDDHLVLFRTGAPNVIVLRAIDGQPIHEWDSTKPADAATSTQPDWSDLRLVRGTRGLFAHPDGSDVVLRVLELRTGATMWHRQFPKQAQVFGVRDCFIGLVLPPARGSAGVIQFLDWDTGAARSSHEVSVSTDLRKLFGFSDAETHYVIVTDQVTDRSLLRARQIHGGFRRPAVNGWLHAFDLHSGTLRWQRRLDNVAFPLDQPRHLPILVTNDVVQREEQRSPTGRLTCIDKRTGESLATRSARLHVYYALESDRTLGEIAVRMKGHTIQLNYRDGDRDK